MQKQEKCAFPTSGHIVDTFTLCAVISLHDVFYQTSFPLMGRRQQWENRETDLNRWAHFGYEGSGGRAVGLEVSGLNATADSGPKASSPTGCEMPCSPLGEWHLTTGLPLGGKRAFV